MEYFNNLFVIAGSSYENLTYKSHLILCPLDECDLSRADYECMPIEYTNLSFKLAYDICNKIEKLEKPVLLQCKSGSRASAVGLIYVARKYGLSEDDLDQFNSLPCFDKAPLVSWVKNCLPAYFKDENCTLKQLFNFDTSTFTYLIEDNESQQSIMIDPVEEDFEIYKSLKLLYAVNTHVHADHITATHLLKILGCQSMISSNSCALAGILLDDNRIIELNKNKLKVLCTPGHTKGCISLVLNNKYVFTGDALFINGCGRTDFQDGNSSELYNSVHNRLFTLEDNCIVLPAHDYKGNTFSTIKHERENNPRLTKTLTEFVELMDNLNLSYPRKIDIAVPRNMKCGYQ